MKKYIKPEVKVRVIMMQAIMAASESLDAKTEGQSADGVDAQGDGISWESIME